MYLVLRRGAVASVARGGELAGAAAVACVRDFPPPEEWRGRPRKVCLRARNPAQWHEALAEPHALAGDAEGEGVAAFPPRRLSERTPLFERLQAMSGELEPPPARAGGDTDRADGALTYVLNPAAQMSSGKTLAQIAHAAVMAAEHLEA